MHSIPRFLAAACWLPALCHTAAGLTVNADFSRDIVPQNPGSNPASVLFVGTGPAPDTGTVWNDIKVPLSTTGDLTPAPSIDQPLTFTNLSTSTGAATDIDIELTSNFYRAFNSTGGTVNNLQRDWIFANNNLQATLTIQGLNPALTYDLHLIASNFATTFTVNGTGQTASGATDGVWTANGEYVAFTAVTPTAGGEIVVLIQGSGQVNGTLAGLQISTPGHAVNFLYPAAAATTGGQFSSFYPPSNLFNNSFTSPADTISTISDYIASGNNHATASGTIQDFDLTFDFAVPATIDGMHVWNYAYRNGANGAASPGSGVNSYTLTFHTGAGGTGDVIGSVFSGNLSAVTWNAENPAQSVYFGAAYPDARSVVMRVLSNHGSAIFTGMNEVAFNGIPSSTAPYIASFNASAPFVQRPATPTLQWSVGGDVTSLSISPGIGDVLPLTTSGTGSIAVSPLGEQTYTLTLNGTIQQTVSTVGLPVKEKVHLYLLIGQSNMQGAGAPYSAALDAPDPRVLKFGSRNGMENLFVKGGHNLTQLETTNSGTGMGIEFGKSLLAAQTDPELVIGLINHALGSSAIQWWAPGVIDNKQVNPATGLNHYLYDEAVQRVNAATSHGVLKGVLWHQGEYNCGSNTDPDSDPDGYAARLQALVSNLRVSFNNPSLPFVCGKFVPETWTYADGSPGSFTGLPFRATVEAALADLPNQRTNTFCVNNDGLRGRSDQLIHFDAYSQRLLGQRYAAAIQTLLADPLRLWLGGYLTPAQMADPLFSGPNADPDGDGFDNLLEFAFLTNPETPQPGGPVTLSSVDIPGEGTFPAISYLRRNDAPGYIAEVSSDLTNWQSNTAGQPPVTTEVGTPVDHGNGTSTVTVRSVTALAAGAPRIFLRIRVRLE